MNKIDLPIWFPVR